MDWQRLVDERNAWVEYNFPEENQLPDERVRRSTKGCVEELGELFHADLKQAQGIRGDAAHHVANAQDAVGDLTVYLLGVINYSQHLPERARCTFIPRTVDETLFSLAQSCGRLCHTVAVRPYHQVLTQARLIDRIVYYLQEYCKLRRWDYEQIVWATWAGVKLRDWIKYPDTGLPPKPKPQTNFLTQAANASALTSYHKGDRVTVKVDCVTRTYVVVEEPIDESVVLEEVVDA